MSEAAPALVVNVVFTHQHRFSTGVLNRVSDGGHIGSAVNPQSVVPFNRSNRVVHEFNLRGPNPYARTGGCARNFVSVGNDFCIVVSGETRKVSGRDDVVVDIESVLN